MSKFFHLNMIFKRIVTASTGPSIQFISFRSCWHYTIQFPVGIDRGSRAVASGINVLNNGKCRINFLNGNGAGSANALRECAYSYGFGYWLFARKNDEEIISVSGHFCPFPGPSLLLRGLRKDGLRSN